MHPAWARPCGPRQQWLVRFAVPAEIDQRSGAPRGVFRACGDALEDTDTPAHVRAILEEELAWFRAHLRAFDPGTPRAIFFFDARAAEHVRRAWRLACALRETGRAVELTRVAHVIEVRRDDHQVAGIPEPRGVFERRPSSPRRE